MSIEAAQLHVIDHPLMVHLLTEARERRTSAQRFRHLLKQIGV
jgi:uracil phosphoribosyltransferase